MPRYYFNVRTPSEVIADHEGSELGSVDAARVEALLDARRLMGEAILQGQDISGRIMEICDGEGTILASVRFSEAIRPGD